MATLRRSTPKAWSIPARGKRSATPGYSAKGEAALKVAAVINDPDQGANIGQPNTAAAAGEVAFRHAFCEDPNGSAIPISISDIRKAEGKSPLEISAVEDELNALAEVDPLLARG